MVNTGSVMFWNSIVDMVDLILGEKRVLELNLCTLSISALCSS